MLQEATELEGVQAILKLTPTGNVEELAQLTVRAIQRQKRTLVYPRALSTSWWFPILTRRITAWLQRRANVADERVVIGGSARTVPVTAPAAGVNLPAS
jgi:hypothetical protein